MKCGIQTTKVFMLDTDRVNKIVLIIFTFNHCHLYENFESYIIHINNTFLSALDN